MSRGKPTHFLDSTALIHAVDKSAEYHKECLYVVNKAAKGQISAATSLETLEEVLFILSKLISPSTAIRVIRDYLKMTEIQKYEMRLTTFENALEIMEMTPLKRPKDAINIATMLEQNIQKIISEDREYDKVDMVQRIHPKDLYKNQVAQQ